MTDLQKIKLKVDAEMELYSNPGDHTIYSFILNGIFYGDETKTDKFMLSDEGGYTERQLDRIKKQKKHFQNRNRIKNFSNG